MKAGPRADRFVFDFGHGNDTIVGFENNQDMLEIASLLVGCLTGGARVLATHTSQVCGSVIFDLQTLNVFIEVRKFTVGDLIDDMLIVRRHWM